MMPSALKLSAGCSRPLPHEVRVKDFGIRSYDLACSLTENYQAAILVDAMPRGEGPEPCMSSTQIRIASQQSPKNMC